jgi:hypothetical protein
MPSIPDSDEQNWDCHEVSRRGVSDDRAKMRVETTQTKVALQGVEGFFVGILSGTSITSRMSGTSQYSRGPAMQEAWRLTLS